MEIKPDELTELIKGVVDALKESKEKAKKLDPIPELEAREIIEPLSPFDEIDEEEILYYATPYYDELQAKKAKLKPREREDDVQNN
jgi:hypothetical protein